MEKASHSQSDLMPLAQPEVADSRQLVVLTKPIAELPAISDRSLDNEQFWTRRKIRPEAEGGNFNNLPVLGLVMEYKDGQAILSVPGIDHVNEMVGQHNPGGFTFIEGRMRGIEGRDTFLKLLANKVFPRSNDRQHPIFGIEDEYRLFRNSRHGEPYTFFTDVRHITPYEHDLIDHLGLAALPSSEADKIAAGSKYVIDNEDPETIGKITLHVDTYLSLISEYATIDVEDAEMTEYRDWVWHEIDAETYFAEVLIRGEDVLKNEFPGTISNGEIEIDWKRVLQTSRFKLDRAEVDKKITEMQSLAAIEPSQMAA